MNKAIEILKKHNEWRRDPNVPALLPMGSSKEIGNAIDTVVRDFENKTKFNPKIKEAWQMMDELEEIEKGVFNGNNAAGRAYKQILEWLLRNGEKPVVK